MKTPHDLNEILAIVDKNDKVIGKASRKEVHDKGLLHREIGVVLINFNKEVLLQKRIDFNVWDTSVGGHFPYNEDYKEAALRETEEELGIKIKKDDIKEIGKGFHSSKRIINKRFVKVFVVKKDVKIDEFKIDKTEIKEIRYFNLDELKDLILKDDNFITSTIRFILKEYIIGKEI